MAAIMSPMLTAIQFPKVILFPKKLRDAFSAGVKNKILPLIKSLCISVPYNFAAASAERGNLKPLARKTNRFKPNPIKGATMNFMLILAIMKRPADMYVIIRKTEYRGEL